VELPLGSNLAAAIGLTGTVTATEPDKNPDNTAATAAAAYPCSAVGSFGADTLVGTSAADTMCGLSGPDRLFGRRGNDTLAGGPGFDYLDGGPGHDVLLGGGEDDTIVASDGVRDRVDCGSSDRDIAVVDAKDVVVGCEIVSRSPVLCRTIGTTKSDKIVGTSKADAICGLPGNDTIDGRAGNDGIDGGQGNDTITGGPGEDRLIGGAGYDVILARDGRRDRIDCGSEIDTVVADRIDHVARNCEHVQRS
jgi:Ca2+-binding RTX toxin-like protein